MAKMSADLEVEICDVADMAQVANLMVELLLEEIATLAKMETMTALQLSKHIGRATSASAFAVAQADRMAHRLRENYYAKINRR
jgi:hypothetical protein